MIPRIPGGFITRHYRLVKIKDEKFWGIRTPDGIELILTPSAKRRLRRVLESK
jgi:hypothetical protein